MFSRQKIAEAIALRFDGAGFADVLAQAPAPATPLRCASVGRFSFGEIGPVRPTLFSLPSTTMTAGPRMPFVPSAVTTPPLEVTFGFADVFDSSDPPPPQPAMRAIAAIATNLRMVRLCPFRQVSCIGF